MVTEDCMDCNSYETTKFRIQRNVGKVSNRVRTLYFRRDFFLFRAFHPQKRRAPKRAV